MFSTTRRESPPPSSGSSTRPGLSRSKASSSSISSISSLNGLLSTATTTTAAATTVGSSTAVLANGHSHGSAASIMANTASSSTGSTSTSSLHSNGHHSSNGNGSVSSPSSSYYPALPYRNKSRTPSVSSTSTITQPFHSLLQTSSSSSSTAPFPKRQGTSSTSVAPTLSTTSATASLATTTTLGSTTSSSSSSPTSSSFNKQSSTMSSGQLQQQHAVNGNVDMNGSPPHPILVLEPINSSVALKSLELPEQTKVKIGRQTSVATAPNPSNGYFDSKVLSRVHAEVWAENGKVFIRDLKSSNGTFLNGKRLSPEGVESEPFVLNQGDSLAFGIDIMDENGALLHEKVSCKAYISRMAYSSSEGSPQESQGKTKSGSPSGSISGSTKSNSGSNSGSGSINSNGSGGQGTNIDLIITRLQNELTRSQETNTDLGALKQGLGDLERVMVSNKDRRTDSKLASPKSLSGDENGGISFADYEKRLEHQSKIHTGELSKLQKSLSDTQAELEAYIQKTQLLEPLVTQDEILRRDLAQSAADLTRAKVERDLAKESMNELINEHQQEKDKLRKEQETALAELKKSHAEALDQLRKEVEQEKQSLKTSFEQEIEQLKEQHQQQQQETLKDQQQTTSFVEVQTRLEYEATTLRTENEQAQKKILSVIAEREAVTIELTRTKTALDEVQKVKEELAREVQELKELASLTPTSATATTTTTVLQTSSTRHVASTKKGGHKLNEDTIAKYEFSWAQFVFPMGGKKNPSQMGQPSTMIMSGGFMLVGIGAYVLWHRTGLNSN